MQRIPKRGPSALLNALRAGHLWLFAVLLGLELTWQGGRIGPGWAVVGYGLALAAVVFLVARPATRSWAGLRERPTFYLTYALAPVVAAFGYWAVLSNLHASGDAYPLAYLPLLNPLDLVQASGLVAVGYWNRILTREGVWLRAGKPLLWALLIFSVFGLSALLVRTVHHWSGVAFSWPELSELGVLQTSLTIFWTVCGLLLMLFGARRRQRPVWLIGAALLALALLKLFFVDLAQVGTVARIVSFIGVGVLLLVTSYLAPVPPTSSEVPEP